MCITEQSRHPSPADGEDTSGSTAVETLDCSVMRIRGPYRSREERGWEGATYDEIAVVLGVTRQRVIQIEREAFRKLKHAAQDMLRVKTVNYKWTPGSEDD